MCRDRHQDRLTLTVLPQEFEAELEVRALKVAIHRLADVVQKSRARGDVAIQSEFLRHDSGEEPDFARVIQDVLSIAGPELQSSHEAQHFGMEIEEAQLKGRRFALLPHRLLHVL